MPVAKGVHITLLRGGHKKEIEVTVGPYDEPDAALPGEAYAARGLTHRSVRAF